MPPRKSGASVASADPNGDVSMISEAPIDAQAQDQPEQQAAPPRQSRKGKGSSSKDGEAQAQPLEQTTQQQKSDVVALDDLLLPRTLTSRLAKGVLPPNTNLQRDALLALTKSATVFISLLASTANEMTERKTIQSLDVLKAIRELELENVMQRVDKEVEVWERDVRGKRRGYRERVKARESGAGDTTLGEGDTTVGDMEVDEEDRMKRPRLEEGGEGDGNTQSAGKIKLNGNIGKRKSDDVEEDVDDPAEEEAEESSDEEVFEDAEEEHEGDETQDAEERLDAIDDPRRQGNGTLAPDGRIEVDGSDDESE